MKAEYTEKESRMESSIEELKATVRDQVAQIEQLQDKLDKEIKERNKETESLKVFQDNSLSELVSKFSS